MSLAKAMGTVGGLTGISRVAGFIRDILTAAILGAGPVADAFFVALKLPNFFRRVTAEGAFSVSFVPLYSKTLEQEGRERADAFASNMFMVMLCTLSVFTLLILIAMPWVIYGIAPGFNDDPARYDLAVNLSRITFPYLMLMSLAALLGGVLNAHEKFAPFAVAPVLFNISLIGALLLAGNFQTAGHAMAWGVLAAGIFQLIFLIIAAKKYGFKIKYETPRIDLKVKEVLRLMGPGVIGAGVMHINLFADLMIASFLASGSISYLYYADRLNQLPLGIVGVAVGTALLPMLSKAFAKGEHEKAQDLFNRALEYCLLLALPAAIALSVIPLAIITVLFERGAFSAADSAVTAQVLMAYALGLPVYIAIKVFSTVHWARGDTVTPVKISVVATVFNVALSIALMYPLGVAGVALATGLAGWVQFAAHIYVLKKRGAVSFDQRFKTNSLKIILATCVMAGVLAVLAAILHAALYGDNPWLASAALGALVAAGMGTYFGMIFISGVFKMSDIKRYLKRRKV